MNATVKPSQKQSTALHQTITSSIENYLESCGNSKPTNLYDLFLEQCEEPLFQLLMNKTEGNQCEVTRILGLSRGTVRKKLKQYGFIQTSKNK